LLQGSGFHTGNAPRSYSQARGMRAFLIFRLSVGTGNRSYCTPRNVERFAKQYVPVSALAERFRRSPKWLAGRLEGCASQVLAVRKNGSRNSFAPQQITSRGRIPRLTSSSVASSAQSAALSTAGAKQAAFGSSRPSNADTTPPKPGRGRLLGAKQAGFG